MKKLLITLLVSVLMLSSCSNNNLVQSGPSGMILPLDDLNYDWGEISIDGGLVSHGFHFENSGEEDLIITGAETSCMCTTAYFELSDGSISPTFGMRGNEEWTYTVLPGEGFELEVYFDPMAHGPNAVGIIKRDVTLFSSNLDGDINMTVSTNVMYDSDYEEKYGDADFVFEETEYDFGVVKQSSGINSYDFEFTYLGSETITVTGVPTSCACTSAEISQDVFEPGDSGVLTVSFDPNLHEEPEGVFFKTVSILTDIELEKQPEVKIWAEMDLDLGPESYTLQSHID